MEQKGSKVQEARKLQRENRAPNPHVRALIFETAKEPLARHKSGAKLQSSGADFAQAWDFRFDSLQFGHRIVHFGARFFTCLFKQTAFYDQGLTNFET